MNRSWASFPIALMALAVVGCGRLAPDSSAASPPARPSATVLRTDVINAVDKASSVHITGTVEEAGQKYTLNMELARSGDISGAVSVNNDSFSLLSTGGHAYIVATAGFLKYAKLPPAACSLVCGKYLELSPTDAKGLVGSLSMKSVLGAVTGKTFIFRYGGSASVNGQPAWLMHDSDGSTAYVSTQGSHYPLRVTGTHNDQGTVDLTQWNSVTIPPAPPASKVVDLSQLEGS